MLVVVVVVIIFYGMVHCQLAWSILWQFCRSVCSSLHLLHLCTTSK